jgi:hypothetical protein
MEGEREAGWDMGAQAISPGRPWAHVCVGGLIWGEYEMAAWLRGSTVRAGDDRGKIEMNQLN